MSLSFHYNSKNAQTGHALDAGYGGGGGGGREDDLLHLVTIKSEVVCLRLRLQVIDLRLAHVRVFTRYHQICNVSSANLNINILDCDTE